MPEELIFFFRDDGQHVLSMLQGFRNDIAQLMELYEIEFREKDKMNAVESMILYYQIEELHKFVYEVLLPYL